MNRVVIITGGGSGIGEALANLYKENGDIVYILNKSGNEKENFFICDVKDEERVKELINKIGEKHGKIDIVINSAGYGISGALELTPTNDVRNILEVNMLGTYFVNKYSTKFLKKGSFIIDIASACALFPLPFRGLYCASKSAVNMYTHSLNLELRPLGINVCSVCPGDTKTNFTKNRIKNFETNERYGNRIANAAYGIDKNNDKRMPVMVVAKKIYKLTNKKKVKPLKIISAKMKLLYFVCRFLPYNILIKFTDKFFGGYKEYENNIYLNNKKED